MKSIDVMRSIRFIGLLVSCLDIFGVEAFHDFLGYVEAGVADYHDIRGFAGGEDCGESVNLVVFLG